MRSSFTISAATTRFMMSMKEKAKENDGLLVLESFADEPGAILNQLAIFATECGRKMTVKIQFANDLPLHEDWNHDLRLGFKRAGEIALILIYVVHHHRLARRCRRAADPLIQRNPRMRSHRSLKMPEHQHGRIGLGLK